MSSLDTEVDGSNPSISMFSPWARDFIRIASVYSAVKLVPAGDNLVKGVQCYELFGGIAPKNHAFSWSFFFIFIFLDHHTNMLMLLINGNDVTIALRLLRLLITIISYFLVHKQSIKCFFEVTHYHFY